jgi:hypothetical protein
MNKTNVIAGFVCLTFGACAFWLSQSVPATTLTDSIGGRFFPQTISVLFMLASLGLIVTGWLNIEISGGTAPKVARKTGPAAQPVAGPDPGIPAPPPDFKEPRFGAGELRLLGYLVVMAIYTVLMPLLGYLVSSVLTFAALVAIAGERRPLRVVVAALGITGALYVIFAIVLRMNVPPASLF